MNRSMIGAMERTLAFDVYGTLIDPMGVVDVLEQYLGQGAPSFAASWREKQLEYLFRRGLGRTYQPFSVCTLQALDFTCAAHGVSLSPSRRDSVMRRYLDLPAYPEAHDALVTLKDAGFRLFAFSNGEPGDLAILLDNAGLADSLDGVISVHDIQSFKPDPSVYAHFLENTGAMLGLTWLVSGNPFDVIGAMEVGWKAAWVRRNPQQLFDPWDIEPTITVGDLAALADTVN